MLRDGTWTSSAKTMVWLSFDALKVVQRIITVMEGLRYSVTLSVWDGLGRNGFVRAQTLNPSTFSKLFKVSLDIFSSRMF